jgi:hypothetical protein
VTAIGGEYLWRGCSFWRAAGDDRDALVAGLSGLYVGGDAFDSGDLAAVGEVDVVVERGGGPDASDLDAAVGVVKCFVLRGE